MTVVAISTNAISSATSSVSFTIDDTYDEIFFTYVGVKGSTDERVLGFQVNTSNGTRNRPAQTAYYHYWHYVHDYSAGGPQYKTAEDKTYTSGHWITLNSSGDTHETYTAQGGELRIFRPSDTTHWKFFQFDGIGMAGDNYDWQRYLTVSKSAGYIRDTAAITYIRFSMCFNWNAGTPYQGNINYGTISMYGIL